MGENPCTAFFYALQSGGGIQFPYCPLALGPISIRRPTLKVVFTFQPGVKHMPQFRPPGACPLRREQGRDLQTDEAFPFLSYPGEKFAPSASRRFSIAPGASRWLFFIIFDDFTISLQILY